MWSASTASTTAPCAPACSVSRIRAACSSAAAAARSETSRCRAICRRTVKNSPTPSTRSTSPNTPAYQAVSWSRSRASCSISARSRPEPVAGAALRRDQLGLEPVVDLAAQATHQHLEHVSKGVVVVVPHVGRDRRAIEHLSRVRDEQLQQGELLRAEGEHAVAAAYSAGGEVDLQVRDAVHRRCERGTPARQRLEPRQQLAEGERLGEVVVRPDLEPADTVVHGIERREHEDGRGHAPAPQLAAQLEPAAAGKAHVENDHIERGQPGALPPLGERRGQGRIDALRAHAVAQQRGELGVVLDDQHPHGPMLQIGTRGDGAVGTPAPPNYDSQQVTLRFEEPMASVNVPLYDPRLVQPMREELTRIGFQELRTPAEVDAVLPTSKNTTLVVVNSVCGCAARNARPAATLAIRHARRPERLLTVFAGQDGDATARARSYFTGYPPSSPQMALFKDGKLVFMLERKNIEGRPAQDIAADLTAAFEKYCR